MLTLAEELFLICLDEDQGGIVDCAAPSLRAGLPGALLAELVLCGKIRLDSKERVLVPDGEAPEEDENLNTTLAEIRQSDRPRKLQHWIQAWVGDHKKIRKALISSLVQKGVLHPGENGYYQEPGEAGLVIRPATPKYAIKLRLRACVFTGQPADRQSITLLGLLRASRLLDLVFTRDEIEGARRRIRLLVISQADVQAARTALQRIETAIKKNLD